MGVNETQLAQKVIQMGAFTSVFTLKPEQEKKEKPLKTHLRKRTRNSQRTTIEFLCVLVVIEVYLEANLTTILSNWNMCYNVFKGDV